MVKKFNLIIIVISLFLFSGCNNSEYENKIEELNLEIIEKDNKIYELENIIKNNDLVIDYDSSMPLNKVEMRDNLIGKQSQSIFDGENLNIVFTYVGVERLLISYDEESSIVSELGICSPINIKNVDTDEIGNNINFVNGQMGYIVFDCEDSIKEDKFIESSFTLLQTFPRTGISSPTHVDVRLSWN